MKDRRLAIGLAVLGAASFCAVWVAIVVALVTSTLDAGEAVQFQRVVLDTVVARWPLLLLAAAPLMFLLTVGVRYAWSRWLLEPLRIAEASQALLIAGQSHLAVLVRTPAGARLVSTLQQLAEQRDDLRRGVDENVAVAARRLEQERSRLAALMSELSQSVVVCNREGRVILYNRKARAQFMFFSGVPGATRGSELLGIGRSIFSFFNEHLIAHAVERLEHGARCTSESGTTQFVTSMQCGQLVRVQVAPVWLRSDPLGDAGDAPAELAGYVLMLDNITQTFEYDTRRDRQVLHWLQSARGAIGHLRHLTTSEAITDNKAALQAGVESLHRLLGEAYSDLAIHTPNRWPLEVVSASDWVRLAAHRLGQADYLRITPELPTEPFWLQVDSYGLLQLVVSLVQRLHADYQVRYLRLRVLASGDRAYLDLVWPGLPLSTETVMTWEMDAMRVDGLDLPLSVRDVLNRHGGQLWFQRDRPRDEVFFRIDLPLAPQQNWPQQADARGIDVKGNRPEFYDFDLFQQGTHTNVFDDEPLTQLAFTVFDTETTGLNPREGDEIIQIGATRIVNMKVLTEECFDQLVDPQRSIPARSTLIHGITQDMVADQPTLTQVLPAFHSFARDSVLVGHNVAFDLRFIEIKSGALGIRFDHPVLDTLLLASVLYPTQESNRLEALAERFGLANHQRHSALGDAMVTAELFALFIPLLAAKGIHTLRQAREASQATYLARLKY
ncbi:MAG: exonuclease domain-containing protein [Rhodoferax sp.]|uniref:3'-5' exonuclease n=1 Tax=Rhodoferax sp. TaxID=50421 RepID=UPI002ACE77FB|nr:exonuclease domain-containing protein [Rhodoferax sp.]MDZ7893420.1 exonuclease domain-containing protein [Rhodoferax sp.]